MSEIGAYDAKTHLPKLLERVEKGERFVITRHGKPVAELIPVAARNAEAIAKAIADVRAVRKRLASRGVQLKDVLGKGQHVRDLAHEGHRY
ncbi:MAG: type II toxin-antitoxin system prevent-host-death family antitoxin [Casimicrobiaceae bacterium]